MIQSAINMIINTIQLSVSPVFGNLVVSSNSEKIQEIFNVIQFVFIVLGMLLCTCMAYLYMPFISIYTEGFTDANYKHPLLAFLFVLAVLVFCLSLPFALFINVYGLYKETYKKDIIFSLISILFSILLTNKFGMPYASVCLILYPLLTFIYRIFIIKNKISWFKLKNFFIRVFFFFILPITAFYLQNKNYIYCPTIFSWILISILTFIFVLITVYIYILIFEKEEFNILKRHILYFVSKK